MSKTTQRQRALAAWRRVPPDFRREVTDWMGEMIPHVAGAARGEAWRHARDVLDGVGDAHLFTVVPKSAREDIVGSMRDERESFAPRATPDDWIGRYCAALRVAARVVKSSPLRRRS